MTDVNTSAEVIGASSRERPHLGVLLQRARRQIDEEVARRLAAAGFTDLRAGHSPVFSFLPHPGARLTELARRARMTKQAMGEVVHELETLGYVERGPDPTDGRAKTIQFTARGRRANEIGILAIRDLEAQWARAIGTERMEGLRSTLIALLETTTGEAGDGRAHAVPPREGS